MADQGRRPRGGIVTSSIAVAMLGAAALQAGCSEEAGGSSANGGTADEGPLAQFETLAPGQSRLSISGAVSDTGEFTTGEPGQYAGSAEDIFRPARGTGSRARRGSNAEGPYAFTIYTDAMHEDAEDKVVRAWVAITLPVDAAPGDYAIAAPRQAEENEAYASLSGDGNAWQFARNVEGNLHIAAIGDTLSAAWDFTARAGGGKEVEVSGVVSQLAFTPQPEARYELTAGGETFEHFGRLAGQRKNDGRLTLMLGPEVYFQLPPDIREGTYPVRTRRESIEDITLNLVNYDVDAVTGDMSLSIENRLLAGMFSLTASGEDSVELSGRFDHFELDD